MIVTEEVHLTNITIHVNIKNAGRKPHNYIVSHAMIKMEELHLININIHAIIDTEDEHHHHYIS
jgi:hypothetical protein